MLNIKQIVKNYEDSARSFGELVPFMAQIAPDLMVNKDGSILACYTMEGVDQEGLPQSEIDHYANLVEHAFRGFGERFTVWFTVDRRRITEYPNSKFENEVSKYIDDLWREQFEQSGQYKNSLYLSVLYTPPSGADGFMEKLTHYIKNESMPVLKAIWKAFMVSISKKRTFDFDANQMMAFVSDMEEKLSSFEQTLMDIDLRRMRGDVLLGFLHRRASPTCTQERVKMPEIPMYMDSYLNTDTLVSRGDTLKFVGSSGTRHIAAMSLKDWPDWTMPGILDDLLAIPNELTISQVFRFSDNQKAKAHIESVERHQRSMQKTFFQYIKESFTKEETTNVNQGRVLLAQDANDALTEMTTVNRSYGYYNLSVVAFGNTENEAEVALRNVNQVLQRRGYLTVRETMHLLSAFAGTIPGQAEALVRWSFVSSGNLADLAPVRTLGIGKRFNDYFKDQRGDGKDQPALTVLSTEFATPYYFNFHQADLAHTLVVGPSRTGKSSFMNFLISQFQKYTPCNTFIFDKDYSCKIPTLMQGGTHVDMGLNSKDTIALNPMRLLGVPEARPWINHWLEMLLSAKGRELKSADLDSLKNALDQLASQPESMWRLQSLTPFLSNELKEELHPWVSTGAYAKFFDNDQDTFQVGDKTCIEMGGLFANETVAALFIDYAFYCIQEKLDGRPTLIYIEEAWFMLANKQFSKGIDNWLRTLAKKNAFLIMATQSLNEVARSPIFATIIDNIPNRIYLPNINAMAHAEMYQNTFGLNEEQIYRIRNGIPKRNYYVVTPKLSRMVDAQLPPEIMAIVRSDSKAQKVFSKHYETRETVEGWRDNYMNEVLGYA
ncbi:hypothetical protein [Azonexus hydrophilus]|uniref:Type IV secretion system protein VirB4 n=1 Tax=Azonexus hydrophilus TaxID=418702 RepID=A0ABZ2XNN4_9RHOO